MANTPGVDGAWSQLAAELGPEVIPIAATIEGLLSVIGMPELFDYIPTVYYMLQGKGVGNPFGVIQNVISQLMSFDPRSILTNQLNNIMKPMTEPIHAWLPYKHNLVNALQTYPPHIQTTVRNLTTTGGFKGEAATTLTETDISLEKYGTDLCDRMTNSIDADNKLLTTLSNIVNQTVSAFVGGGTGVMFAAVAVIDGTTAAQLGIDVPEDILAAIATGLFIAAVSAPLFTASVNTGIAISVWNGVHQQLRDATSITLAPMAVTEEPQLPGRPQLTDAQKQLAENLAKEFGGNVPQAWIEYLLGVIGAGVSATDAAAMIRCLYKGGYLTMNDPRIGSRIYKGAWSSAIDHLDPNDLEGAWKDSQVPPINSHGNHLQEVKDAIQSLTDLLKKLSNKIGYLDSQIASSTDPTVIGKLTAIRNIYETLRNAFQKTLDMAENAKTRSDEPPTWPDQGVIPLGSELLAGSTCATPKPSDYQPVTP
jgi:hypothetical protein